jgi:hypothetical protein
MAQNKIRIRGADNDFYLTLVFYTFIYRDLKKRVRLLPVAL